MEIKIQKEIPWGLGGKSSSRPLKELCLSALFIKSLLKFILFVPFIADSQTAARNIMFDAAV
jgi:hypothetical protein